MRAALRTPPGRNVPTAGLESPAHSRQAGREAALLEPVQAPQPAGGPAPELEAGRSGKGALAPDTLSEVLSQSEVERLLSQVQAEGTSPVVLKSGGRTKRFKAEDVQLCDFRQPAFLTSAELRRLRLRHEEFIRSLAAHLSIYLRLEVVLHMSKLQTLSFQKYADGLANPTHLTLFKVEPLRGVCLLDMSPRLGLTFVDRLLGGPAHSVAPNGDLSDIEAALLDQVAHLIFNEWCALWQKIETTRPVILGHESNARFLNSSAHDSVLLIVSMEARLGDCVEQMQLAFPFLTIEPLVRTSAQAADAQAGPAVQAQGPPQWNPGFDEVPVQLHTAWHGLELSARDLANLKCGNVLLLDANCFDQVEVCLEQSARFHGRLGTTGERWAVELTAPVKT